MTVGSYNRVECRVCGERISMAGFAQYHHKMKHVRDGRMVAVPAPSFDWTGRYTFVITKRRTNGKA